MGNAGETFVAKKLRQQGFELLHRNWRTPFGEVDLVAAKDRCIYIFEVKVRTKSSVFREISRDQQRRLGRAALWIWQKERKRFKFFRCRLLVLTQGNIEVRNLPLLYDTT